MTSLLYFSLQGHGDDDEPEASALPADSTEAAAGSTGGYVADMADMQPPVPLPVAPVEAEESEEDMGNVSWRVFHLPSRELTYPPDKAYLKIFLFPRWDMLISWRVCILPGRSADRDELKSATKVRVEHQPLLAHVFVLYFLVSWDGIRWFWEK